MLIVQCGDSAQDCTAVSQELSQEQGRLRQAITGLQAAIEAGCVAPACGLSI